MVLNDISSNEDEVREGTIQCLNCKNIFLIKAGVVRLLANESETIKNEIEGWKAITHLNHPQVRTDKYLLYLADLSDELPLKYPDNKDAHLALVTKNRLKQILRDIEIRPDEMILDIGASGCWTTAILAAKSQNCFALDISLEKYVGLESADVFFRNGNIFFERIQADMHNLPFNQSIFDTVFLTNTCHHSSNLSALFGEAYRVLKTNGRLVIINEPLKGLLRKDKNSVELSQVAIMDFNLNEHYYNMYSYLRALKRPGFRRIYSHPIAVEDLQGVFKFRTPRNFTSILLTASSILLGKPFLLSAIAIK